MNRHAPVRPPARVAGTRRARFAHLFVVAALAAPSAAHPFTLTELLRMPLERLLQMQITPRHAALFESPGAVAALPTRTERGAS